MKELVGFTGKDRMNDEQENNVQLCLNREAVLHESLQCLFADADPEKALEQLLAYLGASFEADRVYLFEINEGGYTASNTYEWCRQGVRSEKQIMQNMPLSDIDCWMDSFCRQNPLVLTDTAVLRLSAPTIYAILKSQGVNSIAVSPIQVEGKLKGIVGVDNPAEKNLSGFVPLMQVLGYFVAAQLRRRDLFHKLNELGYRDSLTGAYSRNAMYETNSDLSGQDSVGVIYCDVTGLKKINEEKGHLKGDEMIRHCYRLIKKVLNIQWIFRVGGDEFVTVFWNISQEELNERVKQLQNMILQDKYHMAVGYAWSASQPIELEELIIEADTMLCKAKREYYELAGLGRIIDGDLLQPHPVKAGLNQLDRFLATTYHDMQFFLKAIAQEDANEYFYFGDIQKNLFYISDNLRDQFGFESNVVEDLFSAWAQRISSERSRERYWKDVDTMLRDKRTLHDLRYQVKDVRGTNLWIRCCGALQWNEEKTKALFFAGRITRQDDSFVVDPVTNFPREAVMIRQLAEIEKQKQSCLAIGFRLNNITQINSIQGRTYGDRLIREISDQLEEKLSGKMSFYRMDGMRCMAMVEPTVTEDCEQLIGEIRSIIEENYDRLGFSVHHPCSFAVMHYPQPNVTPIDFQENMSALIKAARQEPDKEYMDDTAGDIERIQQLSNLELMLNRDVLGRMENFRAVVQPVVSAQDGKIIGGETLMRWKYEEKDVSPAVFIPVLEKTNMIHMAGRWIFEQAVCACARMVVFVPDFYLTVNVSLHQLSDPEFVYFIRDTLKKYSLDGSHIVVEMTESCMDEEPQKLIELVKVCEELGIRIALDDFGTGYSSLRVLLQYPSQIIKLDRSLLLEMTESEDKKNFISSIVYACHRFGKQVCIEGVETDKQCQLVREADCDMIQGFYYYRPMEINDVYRLLAQEKTE